MALLLRANKVVDGKAEILVDSGQIIIGRLPSNNLVVSGSNIDPIHAMVEVDAQTGEASLIDMGSETGVLLNGRRIEVVEVIKPGDVIDVGAARIEVLDPAALRATQKADGEAVVQNRGQAAPVPPPPSPEMRRTVVAGQKPQQEISVENREEGTEAEEDRQNARKAAVIDPSILFRPGKERPSGSILEVVAHWDSCILDVRHYGGVAEKDEAPRPGEVRIGNEEDGHIIGVGPSSDTRNYLLASVQESRTTVFLSSEMKCRIRRGGRYEKIAGPKEVTLSNKENAIIKHGPLDYFLSCVSLPNPVLKKYEDFDGKPLIFWWAAAVYVGITALLMLTGPAQPKDDLDKDPWETVALNVRTPTPKATVLPAPKPHVEIPKTTPPPMPKETPAPVKTPPPKPKEAEKKSTPAPQPQKANNPAPKMENNPQKDKALGRVNKALPPGNGGGNLGGTAGAAAGQRQGTDKADAMGAEGGKKNLSSGINFDKLGSEMGKTMDINAIGAVATGLKSGSGGAGAGMGSGARGAHGFGGLGNSSSLGTGGPANALAGLGGGAGGLGAGGLGGPGGTGDGSFGKKMRGSEVSVPAEDIVTEGSLTKEEIEAVIRANLAQIKACYERNLQGNRNLQGRVLSAFVIGTSGRVTSSKIAESTLNNGGTEGCIKEAIMRWKFPIPRGNGVVNVRYPFVLQPR